MDEAEVALLDQVEQGQLGGLVLLGDRDDQAQVGLDEGLGGVLAGPKGHPQLALAAGGQALARLLGPLEVGPGGVAVLDGLGQAGLVVLGEQRMLADVAQVQPDEVLVGALRALLLHSV